MNKLTTFVALVSLLFCGQIMTAQATEPIHDSIYLLVGTGMASNGGGKLNVKDTGQLALEFARKDGIYFRFLYDNEGHPRRVGHRDGFAGMLIVPFYKEGKVTIEAGLGPYFSMNTVGDGMTQRNQKATGEMYSLSVKYTIMQNTSLLLHFNETNVSGQFSTQKILLGVGYSLPYRNQGLQSPGTDMQLSTDKKSQISLWFGPSKTTRSKTRHPYGLQIEILKDLPETNGAALSMSAISEGNSTLSNRNGAATQVWYRTPPSNYVFSVGLGPYLAYENNRDDKGWKVLVLTTLRMTAKINNSWSTGAQFSRAASFYDKDQDMFMATVIKAF